MAIISMTDRWRAKNLLLLLKRFLKISVHRSGQVKTVADKATDSPVCIFICAVTTFNYVTLNKAKVKDNVVRGSGYQDDRGNDNI